jgi:hypothetical protein
MWLSQSPPVTAADWFWSRSASVYVVGVNGTIVNVAIPALAGQPHASDSPLQRIADAYTLTFDGVLHATVEAACLGGDRS